MKRSTLILLYLNVLTCLYSWTDAGASAASLDADIGERIYNGSVVSDRSKFPYQVYLRFKEANPVKFHGCGGSLISKTWVLTAGHCCYDPHNGDAIFGTLMDRMQPGGQKISFTNDDIYLHENYKDDHTFKYDICLVNMPEEVNLNSGVGIIPLLDNGNASPDDYVDQIATIAGWGMYDDSKKASNYLRFTSDPIISNDDCKDYYKDVSLANICTSKEISGTCKGDSGGPLTIDVDGTTTQIGLTSFGYPKCSKPDPNVFTYVPAYTDWIKKTMEDNS